MTVTSNVPEPADCLDDLDELQISSSPHIIEFFTARDQTTTDSNGRIELFGQRRELKSIPFRREFLHPLFDPMEEWLRSLVSGAALASLLIGILCLPSATPTKAKRSKEPLLSHADSSLVTEAGLNYEP